MVIGSGLQLALVCWLLPGAKLGPQIRSEKGGQNYPHFCTLLYEVLPRHICVTGATNVVNACNFYLMR